MEFSKSTLGMPDKHLNVNVQTETLQMFFSSRQPQMEQIIYICRSNIIIQFSWKQAMLYVTMSNKVIK